MAVLKEAQRSFPTLRELAVSSLMENDIPNHGNTTLINPYFFAVAIPPKTLDKYTVDSTGKPNKSILSNKPFDDRLMKDDIMELANQMTQIIV